VGGFHGRLPHPEWPLWTHCITNVTETKFLGLAPWYVSNATLHADLGISYVQDVIHQKCNKHHTTLENHENPLLKTLLVKEENRGLKRNCSIDLI
jgi:hypothetical protein